MPKRRRTRTAGNSVTKRIALNKHIATLQKEINRLKREQAGVSRDEFGEVVASVRQLQRNTDDIAKHTLDLATQLTRMGQIQAEVDEIKRALKKAKLLDETR
jgi:phage-related minor tail protein